jgi:hypothetical protein
VRVYSGMELSRSFSVQKSCTWQVWAGHSYRGSALNGFCRADILKKMLASSLRTIGILACGSIICIAGCKSSGSGFDMSRRAAAWTASKRDARQELIQIPLPKKSSYAAIDRESQWQNPFLSVESNTIQVRIYLADQNSSEFDRGGLTRLQAARKQILNVRPKDLPRALASLPDSAWPYGRVVAIAEALEAPRYRAQLKKNLNVTVKALQDMGIVVDDLDSPGSIP